MEKPHRPTVPNPSTGTVGHRRCTRDTKRDRGETNELKSLS
jgi:hypothetical protein